MTNFSTSRSIKRVTNKSQFNHQYMEAREKKRIISRTFSAFINWRCWTRAWILRSRGSTTTAFCLLSSNDSLFRLGICLGFDSKGRFACSDLGITNGLNFLGFLSIFCQNRKKKESMKEIRDKFVREEKSLEMRQKAENKRYQTRTYLVKRIFVYRYRKIVFSSQFCNSSHSFPGLVPRL